MQIEYDEDASAKSRFFAKSRLTANNSCYDFFDDQLKIFGRRPETIKVLPRYEQKSHKKNKSMPVSGAKSLFFRVLDALLPPFIQLKALLMFKAVTAMIILNFDFTDPRHRNLLRP